MFTLTLHQCFIELNHFGVGRLSKNYNSYLNLNNLTRNLEWKATFHIKAVVFVIIFAIFVVSWLSVVILSNKNDEQLSFKRCICW